ncbi:MAG: HNH endonuclease [Kiritimatiellales bacterium]
MPYCSQCQKFFFNPFKGICAQCADEIKLREEKVRREKFEESMRHQREITQRIEAERLEREKAIRLEAEKRTSEITLVAQNITPRDIEKCPVCGNADRSNSIVLLDTGFVHNQCIKTITNTLLYRETSKELAQLIMGIFDYWPEYPPDWDIRRAIKLRHHNYRCEECNIGGEKAAAAILHLHHKTPLSAGGTNHLLNLELLCEICHERRHNTFFKSEYDHKETAFKRRLQIINEAILSGSDIIIHYKKPTDQNFIMRRVTPYRLKNASHIHDEGETLCVEGFCHTRKEDRCFAIKRMKGVKLADNGSDH